MTSTLAAGTSDVLGHLLGLAPEVRRSWLRNCSLEQPGWLTEVLRAAELELGTSFALWRDDPVGFCEQALGESLWRTQRTILESVRDVERTIVPSCHNAGKTFLAARAVAWWIAVHPPGTALAVTTATKWRQVRAQLWMSPSGIGALHARARLPGDCLQTEWQIDGRVVAWGYSPADHDETAFSGIHAPHVLVVVDEAGGLSPTLGRSLESLMSGGMPRMLVIGNPPEDETGTTWMEERCSSPSYNVIRIPAFDTPNFTNEATPACKVHPNLPAHTIGSHLVTPGWVETVKQDEGEASAYYIARVLALFPKDVASKTIPRSWLDDAAANVPPVSPGPVPSDWIRLGVDVAADGGDRFSIARADGLSVRVVHSQRPPAGVTTFDLAGTVLEQIETAEALRRERQNTTGVESPRVRVKVDALGIGMGVADTLRAWASEGRHDAEVVGVKVSERATSDEGHAKYANQRAEMWWLGRLLSQHDKAHGGPAWRLDVADTVLAQLNAPKYGRNASGRILIESKIDMRKRGVTSPDDAESVLLAVYEPGYASGARFTSAAGRQLPTPGRG